MLRSKRCALRRGCQPAPEALGDTESAGAAEGAARHAPSRLVMTGSTDRSQSRSASSASLPGAPAREPVHARARGRAWRRARGRPCRPSRRAPRRPCRGGRCHLRAPLASSAGVCSRLPRRPAVHVACASQARRSRARRRRRRAPRSWPRSWRLRAARWPARRRRRRRSAPQRRGLSRGWGAMNAMRGMLCDWLRRKL